MLDLYDQFPYPGLACPLVCVYLRCLLGPSSSHIPERAGIEMSFPSNTCARCAHKTAGLMGPGLCDGNKTFCKFHCHIQREKKKKRAEPQEVRVESCRSGCTLSALPSLPSCLLHAGCDAYAHPAFRAQLLK